MKFRMFKDSLNAIICFSILLICSCNQQSPQRQKTESETLICDSYERKVKFKSNPQRIISAAPAITEIIFALGEEKRLIARTDFCDFPKQVKNISSIGGLEDPNIESIAALNPDLIIASTHFRKEMVSQIDHLNIPIAVLKNHASFDGAYDLIITVADILGVKSRADSIVEKMKADVKEVEFLVNKVKNRPTVYFVIGFGKTGDFTAGGDTFISELIERAGGTNVAADLKGWSYSLEKLIEHDPDIILIRNGDKEIFSNTEGYSSLKAVKTGKIFEIDNNLFEITGPRLAEGLKQLYSILHP